MATHTLGAAPAAPASAGRLLAAMATACVGAVAAALVAQYGYDMQPCPWCILQRAMFVLIALLCGAAALWRSAPARAVLTGASGLLAVLGVAAAYHQHTVAAKSASCNLTLADKIVNALGLESLVPALFRITASCADAAVDLFGVPFDFWSLALFALLAVAAAGVLAQLRSAGAAR